VEQFGGMGEKEAGTVRSGSGKGKLVGIGDVDWCGVRWDSGWVNWVTGFFPCL